MDLTSNLDRAGLLSFQPCEIVCLEWNSSYLYGEVVQTITDRQVCWVHPLALSVGSLNSLTAEDESLVCYDLRESADLLLPTVLFRSAFDTEVLPLITQLHNSDAEAHSAWSRRDVQHQVNQLIKQLCKAHPEAF